MINSDENISLPTNISELRLSDTSSGGDPDIMAYVRGDKSHDSYIEASLLFRELPQIGVFWHGINWGTHTILDDNIFNKEKEDSEGFIMDFPNIEDLSGSE